MITKEQMHEALPQVKEADLDKFYEPLCKAMAEFEIDQNNKRIAAFLAQVAHESGNLRAVKENLNYKAETLTKVFPKYFRDADPEEYAHQPEKIANRVYANRMGNGDEASGDGFRYCGRGLIQLTGKNNYTACGDDLEVDLHEDPHYLETPEGAARSAAWFWDSRDLNDLADEGDIKEMTKKINGGYIGLEDRIKHYEHALEALGE